MEKLKVALVGAGNRGTTYTDKMLERPDKFQVVAVAEPIESRREDIKKKHGIADDMCFTDWREMFKNGKIADVAIVATMDRDHFEPAMAAIDLKYDLLLEKPVSPEPEECIKIANNAEKNGVKVIVCHVLRYTPMFNKIKDIIESGKIGRVMSINHEECVGNVHQSHSFVRGNWGNSDKSSCMLLQKSCHDMDILQWLLDKKCKKVQSFGTLSYFTRENAPEGSPEYCIEGCPMADTCHYNAVKLYLDDKENDWFRTTCTREANPTDEMVEKSLRTTQYGKCVYKCDNNVVDHQTVNLLFEDNVTVTFTMNAFNKGGRFLHIMGTNGELRAAADGDSPIEVFDFDTRETEIIEITAADGITGGHGGGDDGIVDALHGAITGTYTGRSLSDVGISCNNHLIVFAAEESRKTNTVIDFEEYKEKFKK